MMISPELYYEKYIQGKEPNEIKQQIKKLQSEIKDLKKKVNQQKIYIEKGQFDKVNVDKPSYETQLTCSIQYLDYINAQLLGNDDIVKYTWLNYGQMHLTKDVAKIEIVVNNSGITNKFYNGKNEEFGMLGSQQSTIYEFAVANDILKQCKKIKLPTEKVYNNGGCDGFAWKLEINNIVYEGYLIEPDFIKSIKDVLKFKEIYINAKNILTKR